MALWSSHAVKNYIDENNRVIQTYSLVILAMFAVGALLALLASVLLPLLFALFLSLHFSPLIELLQCKRGPRCLRECNGPCRRRTKGTLKMCRGPDNEFKPNCYNSCVDSMVDLFCGFKLPSGLAILVTFGVIIAFFVVIGAIVGDSVEGLLADREKWAAQWRFIIAEVALLASRQGVAITEEEVSQAAATFLLENVVTPFTALIPAAITYTFLTLAFLVFVLVSPSTFFGDADVLDATDPDQLSCSDDEVQDDELAAAVDNVITAQAAAILVDEDDAEDGGILGGHAHAHDTSVAEEAMRSLPASATRGARLGRRHRGKEDGRRRTMVDRSLQDDAGRAGRAIRSERPRGGDPGLGAHSGGLSGAVTPGTVRRWQEDVSVALDSGGDAAPPADKKSAPTSFPPRAPASAGQASPERRGEAGRWQVPRMPGNASDGHSHGSDGGGEDGGDAGSPSRRGAEWAPPGGDAPPTRPLGDGGHVSGSTSGFRLDAGPSRSVTPGQGPARTLAPPPVADGAPQARSGSSAGPRPRALDAAAAASRHPSGGEAGPPRSGRPSGSGSAGAPSPRHAPSSNSGRTGASLARGASREGSGRRRADTGGADSTVAGRARAGSNLMHKATKVLEVVGLGAGGGSTTEVEEDTEDEIPAGLGDTGLLGGRAGRGDLAAAMDQDELEENRRRLRAWARRQKRAGRYRDNSEAAAVLLHQKAQRRVTRYIVVHTWLSAATAVGVGLSLWAISAPLPALFGLLAFVLNFIPSVGSWIATLLPIPFILFDPDSGYETLLLAILLPGFMQILLGNFVEPALLGKLCKVDPIVILVSILLFGYVWGIAGMILAVPMVVIIKLVFKQIAHPIPRYIAGMIYGNLYRYRARLDRDVRRRIRYERLLRAADDARKTAEHAAFGEEDEPALSVDTPPPAPASARSRRHLHSAGRSAQRTADASGSAKHIRWSHRLDEPDRSSPRRRARMSSPTPAGSRGVDRS